MASKKTSLVRATPKLKKVLGEIKRKDKVSLPRAGDILADVYNLNKGKKIKRSILEELEI